MSIRLLIILLFISFYLTSQAQNSGWTPYYHRDFTIVYPSDWELDTSGQRNTALFLFTPLDDEKDAFRENINLLIQDLTQSPVNLDQYIKITEGQISSMGNMYLLKNERKKAGNRPFHHMVYTGDHAGLDLIFEQYIWVVNNEAFVLTFTCEERMRDRFKDAGQKVLNSFRLKK
jgi:hypothetical protein